MLAAGFAYVLERGTGGSFVLLRGLFPWYVWSAYPFGMNDLSKNVKEIKINK